MFEARGGWLKVLFLALSPLAGLAGLAVWSNLTAAREIRFEMDRGEALQIARRFAESRGVPAQGWKGFVAAEGDDTLHHFYRFASEAAAGTVRRFAPEVRVQAALVSEDGKKAFEAELAPDGRVVGYSFRSKPGLVQRGSVQVQGGETALPGGGDPGEEAALQIALTAFESAALPEDPFAGEPEVRTEREGESITRTFVWRSQPDELPGLSLTREIQLNGSQVVSDLRRAAVDDDFARQNLRPYRVLLTALQICLALGAVFICFYFFVRYVRRAREKEVSHRRSFTLGILVALSFSIVGLLTAIDALGLALKKTTDNPLFLAALVMVVLSYLFLGLLIGVFWGSSEGDVREAFPGKLTSLDALVVGKVFSRNVSLALLTGCAIGAWSLLVSGLVQLPWTSEPTFGKSLANQVLPIYARLPWLTLLLAPILGSVPTVIIGLLLPLAFSYRHFSSKRLRLAFLGGLTVLGCSALGLQTGPFPVSILLSLTMAAFLLFSFYFFDLLTAMAALMTYTFTASLIQISVFTTFGQNMLWTAAGVALTVLGVQLVFGRRGREYSEAEVRPLYAEHQAHRQAMQAEVSAAREAQLRLSPQQLPRLNGLNLAASCRPAQIVGGDFFDFFRISDEKLGIFFAEGGGSGLSAALSIAFAKGLLIPMAPLEDNPSRVVARLCTALGPLMTKNGDMGVLYAVADVAESTLRWARMGSYPRLLVCRENGAVAELEERPAALSNADFAICESETLVGPRDRAVFFTDGVAQALQAAEESSPEAWIADFLSSRSDASAEDLHQAFSKELVSKAKRARQAGPADDLASIFLKFRGALRLPREEVA